jgi:hypothetical protein
VAGSDSVLYLSYPAVTFLGRQIPICAVVEPVRRCHGGQIPAAEMAEPRKQFRGRALPMNGIRRGAALSVAVLAVVMGRLAHKIAPKR